jgi:predicted MFS family arabinose efflux permease
MALYSFVFVGVTPIGSFLMGWISEHGGVPVAYFLGGAASILTVAALVVRRRRYARRNTPGGALS